MKPFNQYLHYLLELHTLMSNNEGDSNVADELRDKMDEPYYKLSKEEIDLIERISEALY